MSLKSILWAVIKRRAICELFAILMPRIRERGEQAAVQFYLLQQTSVGVLLSYFSFILPLCKIFIAPFHQLAVCYDQPNPPTYARACQHICSRKKKAPSQDPNLGSNPHNSFSHQRRKPSFAPSPEIQEENVMWNNMRGLFHERQN